MENTALTPSITWVLLTHIAWSGGVSENALPPSESRSSRRLSPSAALTEGFWATVTVTGLGTLTAGTRDGAFDFGARTSALTPSPCSNGRTSSPDVDPGVGVAACADNWLNPVSPSATRSA